MTDNPDYTGTVIDLATHAIVLSAGRLAYWVAPRLSDGVTLEVERWKHRTLLNLLESRLDDP